MTIRRIAGTLALASAAGLLVLAIVAAASRGPAHGMTGPGHMGSDPMSMAVVSSEFDYLAHMIPHHEEAIVSAKTLLEGTARPEMRAFAQSVIDVQSSEVAQMREWLATWYAGQDATVAYEPMMRDLTGLSGDALDRAFLEDMIPHHMAAVMMSQQLLRGGLVQHDEVAPFAAGIRDGQHAEIFQMTTWLRDRFGQDPMDRR